MALSSPTGGAPLALLSLLALSAACDVARPLAGGASECERCHGGRGLGAAPPRSARGEDDPSARGVGAHAAHLVAGRVAGPVACDECHVVPHHREGHYGDGVTVTFGSRAGDAARWDDATATCAGVYCHGATLAAGGAFTAPVWTTVDGSQAGCGACHGSPPPAPHPQPPVGASCHLCHPATVLADDVSIDLEGGRHVNGALDLGGGAGACEGCHGAPPASGAHLAHATPAGDPSYGSLHVLEDVATDAATYDFGCGHCHPVDPARHLDGRVDVELAPAGAAPGSLKARNDPAASYAAGGGCAGVYCHSSGQDTPAFAATPPWSGAPTGPRCGRCHGNPPRYATGGPGAPDANSHLGLASDGFESGHFGGLPGPWHTSYHGGSGGPDDDAAPITCQTCHYETTDPEATGPSGFYWLDTSGDYVLPGGLLGYACGDCHTGGAGEPPAGAGEVRPLRHVNGRRDVAFDPRLALPALAWLPPAPDTPTRPYWVTAAPTALPEGATLDGATLSLHLGSAAWDPGTKTCTSVACHLAEQSVVWGGLNGWDACTRCHAF